MIIFVREFVSARKQVQCSVPALLLSRCVQVFQYISRDHDLLCIPNSNSATKSAMSRLSSPAHAHKKKAGQNNNLIKQKVDSSKSILAMFLSCI